MTFRITLFNHDEVVVLGVATILARYGRDVGIVDLRAAGSEPVDIVLLDPSSRSGIKHELLDQLKADPRVGRVVAFTRDLEQWDAESLFARGYDSYLGTSLPGEQLVECLRAIHAGTRVLAPSHHDHDPAAGDWPGRAQGLTEREADVLSLISNGLSNSEIADQLGITTNSVKSYIRGAYRTIEVDSRTKAVLWSITHGLRTPAVVYEDPADTSAEPHEDSSGPRSGSAGEQSR